LASTYDVGFLSLGNVSFLVHCCYIVINPHWIASICCPLFHRNPHKYFRRGYFILFLWPIVSRTPDHTLFP
jgi:hypothetical protein